MKTLNILLVFFFITSISCAQKSPRKQVSGNIDGITIAIDYGSPNVKDRTIWGKLVKYDKVWRAGANENTTFSFDKDVIIAGEKLAAGKYGFFMIPNEKGEWIVIFNSKNDSWGHFKYKEKEDVLRIKSTREFVNDNQESLMYTIGDNSIDFAWEKARISIPISKS